MSLQGPKTMILLFLSLFLYNDFINCDEFNKEKFNESSIENHHGHIRNVSAVFKDIKHRRQAETPVAFDHEQQTTNREFLDYSIPEWWWNSTPGIDQTDQITPHMSMLLSTPIGHGKFPGEMESYQPYIPQSSERTEPIEVQDPSPSSKDQDFPPSVSRPTFPFPIETSAYPYGPYYPEPVHPQYPGLTPPPGFPPDYRYPTIYTPPPGELYVPSPPVVTTPELESLNLLPDVTVSPVPTFPTHTYTPVSRIYPPITREPFVHSLLPTFSFTTLNPTVGEYVRIWLQEMANSTVNQWMPHGWTDTPSDYVMNDYTITTERFPPPIERANTDTWSNNMQLKMMNDLALPVQRRRSTAHPDKTVVIRKELQSTPTIKLKKKFNIDNNTTDPKKDANMTHRKLKKVSNYTDVNSTKKTTTEYVFLNHRKVRSHYNRSHYNRHTTARTYYDMIDQLHEGYLIVFLIELSRLVAMKDKMDVYEVVRHADSIVYRLHRSEQLAWLSHPLIDVTRKMASLLLETDISIIQSHVALMHHALKTRKKSLSGEVNTILEYAEMLYTDTEGKELFSVLKDFSNYPKITLTGYWLCDSLIENFLRPYRRLSHKQRVRRLIDSINFALISRFPQLEIALRNSKAEAVLEPPTKIQQQKEESEEKEILTQKEYITETTTVPTRERKRQRHLKSHERSRHRNRRRHKYRPNFGTGNIYYRRQYRDGGDYVYPLLRSMKPITSVQKRFRVVTSKYQWKSTKRRTRSAFIINLMTRPTRKYSFPPRYQTHTPFPLFHENFDVRPNYKRYIQPNYDSGAYSSTMQTNHRDKRFYYRQMENLFTDTESTAERENLKAELVRRIVEGSSEDEESMNLVEALLHGRRTFNIEDDSTSD